MNDKTKPPLDDLAQQSARKGKDAGTRRVLIFLLVLWLLTLIVLIGVSWNAYRAAKDRAQTLAQQITFACETGDLGPGISVEDEEALCDNAEKVIQNDPELQENEIQEGERQEPELQEDEFQESERQEAERQQDERQDSERQDEETQDEEVQESETQDDEIQDAEIQEEEIQEEEVQDPEKDDPDPNDDIRSGSCTFDGVGTITFTFETTSGPVTFQCTGTSTPPGQQ